MKNYFVRMVITAVFFNLYIQNTLAFDIEHEAHEHGHATLTLVQEKGELQLALKSPAMNIVGFEHPPSTKEQHEKIDQARLTLNDVKKLFVLSESAKCVLEHVHIASSLLEEGGHNAHAEEAHDKHEGGEHESEEMHSEFEAEYHFECKNLKALKEISVVLLDAFPSIEELEAKVITNNKQQLIELSHDNKIIKF